MMKQKILIVGVTGMVGHKLFGELSKNPDLDVYGACRSSATFAKLFDDKLAAKIIDGIDATKIETIAEQLEEIRPDVVINCIGITKVLADEADPLLTIETNSCYPHRLAKACEKVGARMIQIATDCVFNGQKGNYTESDPSDATDLYGRSKFLGEVNYPNALTIRTSFIGHEIGTHHGLLEWFLAEEGETKGFTRAIYSGMPTVLIARVITDYILTDPELHGLYQVSSDPINKHDLLGIIAEVYKKQIKINPEDSVKVDRSLDSTRFRKATGYKAMPWRDMIELMYADYKSSDYYRNRASK